MGERLPLNSIEEELQADFQSWLEGAYGWNWAQLRESWQKEEESPFE